MSDLMLKLYVSLQTLRAREEGQGMVEYALILVLVSVVAIVALTAIGDQRRRRSSTTSQHKPRPSSVRTRSSTAPAGGAAPRAAPPAEEGAPVAARVPPPQPQRQDVPNGERRHEQLVQAPDRSAAEGRRKWRSDVRRRMQARLMTAGMRLAGPVGTTSAGQGLVEYALILLLVSAVARARPAGPGRRPQALPTMPRRRHRWPLRSIP